MADFTFKLVENENETKFSFCSTFQENSLDLIVFQRNSAWKSTIEWNEIRKLASQHKANSKDYFAKLKACLETPSPDVTLTFIDSEFTIIRILENNLRLKFFVTKLQPVDREACTNGLLQALHSDKSSVSASLKRAEEALDKERKDKAEYMGKLVELVRKKNEDDAEMCGKFVLVLNEKKREIQHLRELLDAFQNGRPRANPVVDVKKRKRKNEPVQKKEVVSESGSEDDDDDEQISNYNTSDDEDDEKGARRPKKLNLSQNITNPDSDTDEMKEQPSTSSTYSRFLEDSPPRQLLTKRKSSPTEPLSSKRTPPVESKEKDVPVEKEEVVEEATSKKDEQEKPPSPVVDFNTQDLLEML